MVLSVVGPFVVGLEVVRLDVKLAVVGLFVVGGLRVGREWWDLQLLSLMWTLQLVPTLGSGGACSC